MCFLAKKKVSEASRKEGGDMAARENAETDTFLAGTEDGKAGGRVRHRRVAMAGTRLCKAEDSASLSLGGGGNSLSNRREDVNSCRGGFPEQRQSRGMRREKQEEKV